MSFEEKARAWHGRGLNCGMSVYSAFAEELGISADEAKSMAPRPRDEGGKCGAYLAGKKVLSSLNPSAVEEFEKRFVELNGSCECAVLRARRAELKKTCDDFIGDAARLVEEALA